ncbi:MAG: hypothetical protein IT310_13370, partial [Anaerolineales bacterium]|nr:hypothetical protein [Anaerolineales bacterium]
MATRTGFGIIIPLYSILLYFAFRASNRIGDWLSASFTVALFALGLAGLWASGQTQTTVLNGILPLYDAQSYYIDALQLINGDRFSTFSARRPLFPALSATLLSITGYNLMVTLGIFTIIAAYACYFAAKEIQKTHGTEVAVFILMILFLFFRAHSGVHMSENLGVALGALGFALLWQGAARKNLTFLCMGLFIATLALNARAGAFFMLPLLILWVGRLLKEKQKFGWKAALWGMLAVALGFALNLILTRLLAASEGVPFANFSYTLYGLASGGKSWAYIFSVHPEVLSIPEPEKTKRIYQLAFDLILSHPLQALQGSFFNWKMLFSDTWYNIYSYVGGENPIVNRLVRWGLYLLGATGIYSWFKDRDDPIKSLIFVSFLGVFISVPFLPPTDAYRMRPYAASIIVLAALPALGLEFILNKLGLKKINHSESLAFTLQPALFAFGLVLILLSGSLLLKAFAQP